MKPKMTLAVLTAIFLIAPIANAARQDKPANCELRLVTNAGAGEVMMAFFTRSKEECLEKSDSSVEAKFRTPKGMAKRGGAGPKP